MSKFTQEIKSEIVDKYKKGADVTLLCKNTASPEVICTRLSS